MEIYTLYEITPSEINPISMRLTSNNPINKNRLEIYVDNKVWNCCSIELTGIEKTTDDVTGIRLKLVFPESLRNRQSKDNIIRPNTLIKRIFIHSDALDFNNFTGDFQHPTGIVKYEVLKEDYFIVRRINNETFTEIDAQLSDLKSSWNHIFRPNIPGRCYHKYRGTNCGYNGSNYWDRNNNVVTERNEDVCQLSIKACELRFPTGSLPFGGVPQIIQEMDNEQN